MKKMESTKEILDPKKGSVKKAIEKGVFKEITALGENSKDKKQR